MFIENCLLIHMLYLQAFLFYFIALELYMMHIFGMAQHFIMYQYTCIIFVPNNWSKTVHALFEGDSLWDRKRALSSFYRKCLSKELDNRVTNKTAHIYFSFSMKKIYSENNFWSYINVYIIWYFGDWIYIQFTSLVCQLSRWKHHLLYNVVKQGHEKKTAHMSRGRPCT